MIELGLERLEALSRLISRPLPWKAFHIAGTNGKGTVAVYLSALLRAQGHRTGRFTSPHLIDRWDCIAIDGTPVNRDLFRKTEDIIANQAKSEQIQASEFELLTATAFEIFTREKVKYAVVECGMGGRLDATNVFTPDELAASIITKIDLEHQRFLGQTIDEITAHKAGIMRRGVPCITFRCEDDKVRDLLAHHAHDVGAPFFDANHDLLKDTYEKIHSACKELAIRSPQSENVALAYAAINIASANINFDSNSLKSVIYSVSWPGRLQIVDLMPWVQSPSPVLLDGAHNSASAVALRSYVDHHVLQDSTDPVNWVLAFSAGKDIQNLLRILIRPQDEVHLTCFGPVDGMPWVKSESISNISDCLSDLQAKKENAEDDLRDPSFKTDIESGRAKDMPHEDQFRLVHDRPPGLSVQDYEQILRHRRDAAEKQRSSIERAVSNAGGGLVVIAGSLYLVGDIFRSLREHERTSKSGYP